MAAQNPENETEKKRFSLNDMQKMCMGVVAVAGLWYNQIRESDRIRADFREYVAVQTGIDRMQDFKINQAENTLNVLLGRFDSHINHAALKPDDIHIESD